jgi:HK97 family phage portal protein
VRLFGIPLPFTGERKALSSVTENRAGWFRVFESFSGAWQQNVTVDRDLVLSYHAIYACMTLIAADISKLRIKLVQQDPDTGIWSEIRNNAYTPVLRKPNPYQNRIQFLENWILSKLIRGNTYVLKVRDNRGVVTGMYVLDPNRVTPLVSDSGEVFYQLMTDNLAAIESDIVVPAREIIHDRMNCLFHPLVGVSPIFAAGVAATQGLRIQNNSANFFGNNSQPGGILTAAGAISDDTAARLKAAWESGYTGKNAGKIAVVGDGLEFKQLTLTAEDSQLIEQLRWTSEVVCSVFHVPPYKIGVGPMPTYNNIQSLNVEYYSQCLQKLIEDAELCLDEGLQTKEGVGTEFDLKGLLRMDSVTQMEMLDKGIKAGLLSPDEGRRDLDLPPVPGGNTPYLQQQNYSLAALAKRDAQENPFGASKPAPAPAEEPAPPANDNAIEAEARAALIELYKGLR